MPGTGSWPFARFLMWQDGKLWKAVLKRDDESARVYLQSLHRVEERKLAKALGK